MLDHVNRMIEGVKDGEVKVGYFQTTLEYIAQEMAERGNANAKELADKAWALTPLYKENKDELLDAIQKLRDELKLMYAKNSVEIVHETFKPDK